MKIRNIFGTEFSGAIGKKMVAATWKGREYVRAYRKPANPNTEAQEDHRALFNEARGSWKELTVPQRTFFRGIAGNISGYNLYVGRYIKAARGGDPLELPIVLTYKTKDGQPVPKGLLVVRHGKDDVFRDKLEDAEGVIALTPSDAPYTFVLRKGLLEDQVLTIEDLLETDVPKEIASERLGVTLVLDVEGMEPEPAPGR